LWSFVACAAGCVISLVWLLVTIVLNFFRHRSEGQ
jgi:hypothetical protein